MSRIGETHPRASTPETPPSSPAGRVHFEFEGRRLEGVAGESIACALFRHGVRVLSHSVKYHRPRAIFCGRNRCVHCAVEVDGVSGVKACTTPLAEGMRIRRQKYLPWYAPALTWVMRRMPFPAGFYFHWFSRPTWVRTMFLASLRRMAGVGRVNVALPPATRPAVRDETPALASRYDVIVVGAGVSGLSAAKAAAGAGAAVLLLDEYAFLGGHSIGHQADGERTTARDGLARAVTEAPGITVSLSSTVQGCYGRTLVVARGRPRRLHRITAPAIVFATGAHDAVPLFTNNDMPGIFGARGLRLFLERDDLVPGAWALVYGGGDEASRAAALLAAHGVRVAAVASTDDAPVAVAGAAHHRGARVVAAHGRTWVREVEMETRDGRARVACDLVCVAAPGQPAFELAQQAGFAFALSDGPREDLRVMVPSARSVDAEEGAAFVVGETAGITDWTEKIEDAARVGAEAAGRSRG